MPFIARLAAALALLALPACATLPGGEAMPTARCEQRTPEVFALHGDTDAALAACVAETIQPTTRELILDSPGGNVATALDIAAHFEGRGLLMRVDGECNSSCANYFLPLARRIVVEPGAYVIQHGSIDPQFLGRMHEERAERISQRIAEGQTAGEAEAAYDRFLASTEETMARQDAFAARNGVPPGWLFRRHSGSNAIDGMEGGPSGPARAGVVVEHALMRSCLTRVEIEPYDTRRYGRLLDPVYGLFLAARGLPRSGDMRCAP